MDRHPVDRSAGPWTDSRSRILEYGGIGGEAVGQFSGPSLVEEADVLLHHGGVEIAAKPGHHPFAGDREEVSRMAEATPLMAKTPSKIKAARSSASRPAPSVTPSTR